MGRLEKAKILSGEIVVTFEQNKCLKKFFFANNVLCLKSSTAVLTLPSAVKVTMQAEPVQAVFITSGHKYSCCDLYFFLSGHQNPVNYKIYRCQKQ